MVSQFIAKRYGCPVLGVDASPSRIAVARQASACLEAVKFAHSDIAQFDLPPSQMALLIDVLGFFSDAAQRQLLRRCREALCPDGLLIVKDTTTVPRWKYHYANFEETLKFRLNVYGLKTRRRPNYHALTDWRALLQAAGFEVCEENLIAAIAPYPGVIYVCRRRRQEWANTGIGELE